MSAARLEDGRMTIGAGPRDPMLWLETADRSGFEVSRRVPFHAAFLVATGDHFLLLDDSAYAVALFVDPDTGAPSQGPEVGGRVLDAIADADGRVFVRLRGSSASPRCWRTCCPRSSRIGCGLQSSTLDDSDGGGLRSCSSARNTGQPAGPAAVAGKLGAD
ncbi:MAG: hypothetical protein V4850_14370 [Myxococcota bacterium]